MFYQSQRKFEDMVHGSSHGTGPGLCQIMGRVVVAAPSVGHMLGLCACEVAGWGMQGSLWVGSGC